jgi:hypothetical protein
MINSLNFFLIITKTNFYVNFKKSTTLNWQIRKKTKNHPRLENLVEQKENLDLEHKFLGPCAYC